jgi:ATP-dependent Lon protease
MNMDSLDKKILAVYPGKVVRKDLLHRIKKGTNVPTFVLEFLLARYCASDDPYEIEAGLEAVIATLQDNYVRPDESNAAQSKVATRGRHKFFDKVLVRYIEKQKRHWAVLENFNSQRIAIAEKFYRDNDRLLEGGVWAEVTVGYNEVDDDDYAFYIEDLRPIQLSRFDFEGYIEGRKQFSRDEWLDLVLRSVGLEPSKINHRQKLHTIVRLAPLVEQNFNFIELGPRGTGKSYFFSEFSPYSTLISGGQASKAALFYNNARRRVGLVGFWDTVAFDEVAGIKIRDPDTMQIMKDFMANGRFSRGVEVIADASLVFIGNIDHSIEQVIHSTEHDLFMPLPKEFDLAIMDRFAFYLPGWEMVKTSTEYLTENYGLITDYIAEAFHYQFAHTNRYDEVTQRIRLGSAIEGRDEKGIKKTLGAMLKILHPDGPPSDDEFEEYVAYAIEGRRRIKEQMNKRKPDDEFAKINLSFFTNDAKEIVVYCPESKDAPATQNPVRPTLEDLIGTEKIRAEREIQDEEGILLADGLEADEEQEEPPFSIVELIREGESENLEFKSTLQWDVKEKKVNKVLRKQAIKSIAAFLNSSGGTLLIGIDNHGSIVGIADDLRALNESKDKFAVLLARLIADYIGIEFSQCIKISFEGIGDQEICRVDAEKAHAPAYFKGERGSELYTRFGPSTRLLDTKESVAYIKANW